MDLSRRLLSLLLALLLAAPATVEARNRKGDKLLKEGQQAEQKKNYDEALVLYEKAVLEDPSETAYQLALRRVRFQAAQAHVDRGKQLRDAGNLEEALKEYQHAYAIDPSSMIAEQELRSTGTSFDQPVAQMSVRPLPPGADAERKGVLVRAVRVWSAVAAVPPARRSPALADVVTASARAALAAYTEPVVSAPARSRRFA